MKIIRGLKRNIALTLAAASFLIFGQNFVSTSVSIADYGAVADGQTDNLAAINKAIAAAAAQGSYVYIPEGNYAYGGVIRMTGVKMRGAGSKSVLYALNPSQEAIFLYGDGPEVSNLRLSGVVSASRQAAWESTRITIFGATNFLIENLTIDGSAAAGIQTDSNPKGGTIQNNVIKNTLADSIHITSRASFITIQNNRIENSGDDGIAVVSYQYDNDYVNNITARNNIILNNKHGRNMSVVGGKDIVYENNYMEGNPNWACVYIAQEGNYGTYAAHNVKINYNTLKNCGSTTTGHGAVMLFSEGFESNENISFLRNDVIQLGQAGIRIFSDKNVGITLDNNRVAGAVPDYDITSPGVTLVRYSSGSVGYNAPSTAPTPTPTPSTAVDFTSLSLPEGQVINVGNGMGLVMQSDGNLVLYGSSGALWATGTSRNCAGQCGGFLQNDGNFVLYHNGSAFWSTGTYGIQNFKLRVSPTKPYLQILSGSLAVWKSN